MATVAEYFTELAGKATRAVGEKFRLDPQALVPVADTTQRSAAASWQSVAVHPMHVLETGYQDVVRQAGAGATTDDARRDAESLALTRFFALGSGPLLRLDLPAGLAGTVRSGPLVEELLDRVAAASALVHDRLDHGQWGTQTLGTLRSVVDAAADAVVAMAPAGVSDPLPAGVARAARYLGMLGTGWTRLQAVEGWSTQHQGSTSHDALVQLLTEVDAELVAPLRAKDAAVAAVRTVYNIEAFTLLRLLHRFEGGNASTPMTSDQRRFASETVTGAMHPASVGTWLEGQLAALAVEVASVDSALRTELGRPGPVLRFYLKGGRALFTALGTPAQGTNDWDTGILVDPGLDPDRWYTAFAAVHDAVVRVLDGLRYGYTQHLYADVPAVPVAQAVEADVGNTVFSVAAELAEDQLHRAQVRQAARVGRGPGDATSPLVLVGEPAARPLGVNGELIDVGIPTRGSIELRELWRTLTVAGRPGVSGVALPVPTLPYFVTDLSTIVREAFVRSGEPDGKLGKRLVRLSAVLTSDGLATHATEQLAHVRTALPKAAARLALTDDRTAPTRLTVATLADLVESLALAPDLLPALDAHLAAGPDPYDEADPAVRQIWGSVAGLVPAAQQATARSLLSIHAGAHRLARTVLKDRAAREAGLGIDPSSTRPQARRLNDALDALTQVVARAGSTFVVTGALALRLQLVHAGSQAGPTVAPVDRVTGELRVADLTADRCVTALESVGGALRPLGTVAVEGTGFDARLLVRVDLDALPELGDGRAQVALVVRPVTSGGTPELDTIRGWSVEPPRRLVEQVLDEAASTPDFDLREALHVGADAQLQQVLGRPVGVVRGRRAF